MKNNEAEQVDGLPLARTAGLPLSSRRGTRVLVCVTTGSRCCPLDSKKWSPGSLGTALDPIGCKQTAVACASGALVTGNCSMRGRCEHAGRAVPCRVCQPRAPVKQRRRPPGSTAREPCCRGSKSVLLSSQAGDECHGERPGQRSRPVQARCCREPSTQHALRGRQPPRAVSRLRCHAPLLTAPPCKACCGQTCSSGQHGTRGQPTGSSRARRSAQGKHVLKPERSSPTGCGTCSKGCQGQSPL